MKKIEAMPSETGAPSNSVHPPLKKGFKGIARLFKQDSFKAASLKFRIPSFRQKNANKSPITIEQQNVNGLLKEIPSLDFPKLKADLYIDLAYTNNLLRQRIHRENLENLVAQITECLRLIRCRVATAAAYIQTHNRQSAHAPPPPPANSDLLAPRCGSASTSSLAANSNDSYTQYISYSENRLILDAVSRFESAYIAFSCWLSELRSLKVPSLRVIGPVLPVQLEHDIGVGPQLGRASLQGPSLQKPVLSMHAGSGVNREEEEEDATSEEILSSADMGEVMSRGNACFLTIQRAAESIFLSLEASGCRKPTTPQELSIKGDNKSTLANLNSANCSSMAFTCSPMNPEAGSSNGLTPEDRELLASLWSQAEPFLTPYSPPPPKPPLLLLEDVTGAGESLMDSPYSNIDVEGYTNVRSDAKLNDYLQSLAKAVRFTIKIPVPNDSAGMVNSLMDSIYSTLDSSLLLGHDQGPRDFDDRCDSSPPSVPPRDSVSPNRCLDLNESEALDFPNVDDSDASEKENNAFEEAEKNVDYRRSTNSKSLGSPISSEKLPDSLDFKPPGKLNGKPQKKEPVWQTLTFNEFPAAKNSQKTSTKKSNWIPITFHDNVGSNPSNNFGIALSKYELNPLSDISMQGDVMNAVLQMRETSMLKRSDSLDRGNQTSQFVSSPCGELNEVDFANSDVNASTCQTQTKSDIEDDFEVIEANGKKYKRYFQRHIVFQRHKCRQMVIAPSLPDGSGPDMTKQMAQGPIQICQLDSTSIDMHQLNDNANRSPSDTDSGVPTTSNGDCSNGESTPSPQSDDIRKPCDQQHTGKGNSTLTNYMYRFGRSELNDPLLENRISRRVADFFHAKWRKRETAQGPHDRSKTVAYVHKYSQSTPSGSVIHHATCAESTCTVRMSFQPPTTIPKPVPIQNKENRISPSISCASSLETVEVSTFPRPPKSSTSSRNSNTIDRRKPLVWRMPKTLQPASHIPRPDGQCWEALSIEVPTGSQPALNNLETFQRMRQRSQNRRKVSLELLVSEFPLFPSSTLSRPELRIHPPVLPPPCDLPSVEETERIHPLLLELDAIPYLDIESSDSETDITIQAGTIDALIVYATSVGRSQRSFLLVLDVFLVMYRTFISSQELITRLIRRYLIFQSSPRLMVSVDETSRNKICNVVISYLIRVISQLSTDFTLPVYSLLAAFRQRVVSDGHMALGKVLEVTISSQQKKVLPSPETPPMMEGGFLSEPRNVRRSHSIGAVPVGNQIGDGETPTHFTLSSASSANRLEPSGPGSADSAIGLPLMDTEMEKLTRNSFSIGVGTGSLQSSPSCSTTFSDMDLDYCLPSTNCNTINLQQTAGSCYNSPIVSRRLLAPITYNTNHQQPISIPNPLPGRNVSLLDFSAKELAEQITYLEAEKYRQLTLGELLDIKSLAALKAPGMAACAAQFSALSNWAATLLVAPPASQRERHAVKLLKIMEHLHFLKNFNSYLAILVAFLLIPDSLFSKKTRARLARLRPYMQPPHFSTYRRELAEASAPLIPYLGLTLQNLIALDQVNPLFLSTTPKSIQQKHTPEHGEIVNFWRCWKHFLIIHFFVKQENSDSTANRYDIKKNDRVLDFIDNFTSAYPDFALRELISRRKRETS